MKVRTLALVAIIVWLPVAILVPGFGPAQLVELALVLAWVGLRVEHR